MFGRDFAAIFRPSRKNLRRLLEASKRISNEKWRKTGQKMGV